MTMWRVCRVAVLRDTPQAYVLVPAAPRLGNRGTSGHAIVPLSVAVTPNAPATLQLRPGRRLQLVPARALVPRAHARRNSAIRTGPGGSTRSPRVHLAVATRARHPLTPASFKTFAPASPSCAPAATSRRGPGRIPPGRSLRELVVGSRALAGGRSGSRTRLTADVLVVPLVRVFPCPRARRACGIVLAAQGS
jgi:hypothetical protein